MTNKKEHKEKTVFPSISGKIPGTLIYKGNKSEPFKAEVYSYNAEKYEKESFNTVADFNESKILNEKKENVKWINITGINNTEEVKKLEKIFCIPNYILEQVIEISKHSTFKVTDDLLYTNVQMIYYTEKGMVNEKIGILLFDDLLFTFQEREKGMCSIQLEFVLSKKKARLERKAVDTVFIAC